MNVTVLFLVLLFRNFEWQNFWLLLQSIPLWLYGLSLLIVFLGQVIYTLRWQFILNSIDIKVSFSTLLRQYLIALFFNNFLPTGIGGDWARIYYLGRRHGYVNMTASVFMERFLGFFAFTLIGVSLGWALKSSSAAFVLSKHLLTVCLLIFAVSFLLAILSPWLTRSNGEYHRKDAILPKPSNRGDIADSKKRLQQWISRSPKLAAALNKLEQFLLQVRDICRRPLVILAVCIAVLTYLLLTTWVYQTFFALAANTAVSFWVIMASLAMMFVLSNIPITVNGIGLREQLHYVLFAAFGISKEVAVGASLMLFSNLLILSLLGCFFWWNIKTSKAL